MSEQDLVFFVFLLLILSGMGVVLMGMRHRGKMLEMAHRERMAMIEKGLMPSPERDPGQFYETMRFRGHSPLGSQRAMSIGIVVIGFGLGLALIIGFAGGAPGAGVGVGGAIALLGAAFVVNALLARSTAAASVPPRAASASLPAAGSDEPER